MDYEDTEINTTTDADTNAETDIETNTETEAKTNTGTDVEADAETGDDTKVSCLQLPQGMNPVPSSSKYHQSKMPMPCSQPNEEDSHDDDGSATGTGERNVLKHQEHDMAKRSKIKPQGKQWNTSEYDDSGIEVVVPCSQLLQGMKPVPSSSKHCQSKTPMPHGQPNEEDSHDNDDSAIGTGE
ncbi:hypothetical protein EDC04DRAFT_2601411 [Pisolithus marmoratus]|nr:hypothetical protein EDC04DRAFT_2601411 [Pisolithus marmoratus]